MKILEKPARKFKNISLLWLPNNVVHYTRTIILGEEVTTNKKTSQMKWNPTKYIEKKTKKNIKKKKKTLTKLSKKNRLFLPLWVWALKGKAKRKKSKFIPFTSLFFSIFSLFLGFFWFHHHRMYSTLWSHLYFNRKNIFFYLNLTFFLNEKGGTVLHEQFQAS